MSWQDRELARVKRAALNPAGFYRADAPVNSALLVVFALVGVVALIDLMQFWVLGHPANELSLVAKPIYPCLAAGIGLVQWWRQRAAYHEYCADKSIYDASDSLMYQEKNLSARR
jgi:hypothetical protein